jgi:hypothetical protein
MLAFALYSFCVNNLIIIGEGGMVKGGVKGGRGWARQYRTIESVRSNN